jgi:N-acetylglucosaminyl-diphospho-decaprenol L-rhamnosyltransferase
VDPEVAFSIVIVNMNAAAFLERCLESIVATRGDVTVQIVLVDNGSTDGSLDVARRIVPDAVVLPQARNIGYVPANNVGLAKATGKYVMFLNNDTELLPGCLGELAAFLDAHPEAGAVSGQILNPDGTDQGCARRFPSVINGLFGRRSVLTRLFPNNRWSRAFMVGRHHQGDEPFEVEILSAACLVLRTDLARSLRGMDEAFQLYWVCAELCSRVLASGHTVVCVPKARLIHFEGKGGSTRTFRQRSRMTIAFNRDAYLAYVKVHALPPLHPRRLFAAFALSLRTVCLMALQLARPTRATSSGGAN